MTDTVLADRAREILAERDPDDPFITYQALASDLGLRPPGTIQRVAAALEQTMREDVAAGRPMIAALVISRAGDMPRRGFFDLAVALGVSGGNAPLISRFRVAVMVLSGGRPVTRQGLRDEVLMHP